MTPHNHSALSPDFTLEQPFSPRILSLGAGVQSSTLLLMATQGELSLDGAIFADTGWEPKATYAHLDYLETQAPCPVYRVSAGNIREAALSGQSSAWIPLYILNQDGGPGMLRRQCTKNYKITPIRRKLRELGYGPRNPVEQVIGISLDEAHRMRDSDAKYIHNVYPLIERRMTRLDCLNWLGRHGYPTPPKSACIGCPYHDDRYWRGLRDNSPDEWADAVDFDDRMRHFRDAYGQAFVHAQRVPLSEVDLSTPQDHGQMDMFGEECEGVCGV